MKQPQDSTNEPIPVVAYVRTSTEHRPYLTTKQLDQIKDYAERRGMRVSHVYADSSR